MLAMFPHTRVCGRMLSLRRLRCSSALPHFFLPSLRHAFLSNASKSTRKPAPLLHICPGSSGRAFSSRQMRSVGGGLAAGGQGRGLIDDEAELSDWVEDLKGDFFRDGLDRGKEGVDRGGAGGRSGRGREVVDRGGSGGRSGRGRDRGAGSKRRRGGDLDEEFDSILDGKKGRARTRFLVDSDDDEGDFSGGRGSRELRAGDRDRGSFGGSGRGSSTSRERGAFREYDRGNLGARDVGTNEFSSSNEKRGRGGPKFGYGKVFDGRKDSYAISEDESDDDGSLEDESDVEDELVSADEAMRKDGSGIQSSFLGLANRNDVQPKPECLDAQLRSKSSGESKSYLSETRFDQCSLSQLSLRAIKEVGYERMTVVQEATLPVILKGQDVLAKAKTGTGKTVAFLLPAIEIILKQPPVDRDNRRPPIYVLVICPTRELANQAAMEAHKLLKYHPNIGVQFVTGGTRLALEQKRLQANPCQILVATPGRLRDHTENTAGFATRLKGVKVLVLDEADRLLDMGFRKDIENIVLSVPKQRQTLLFSATVPDEVRHVCHIALRRDHEYINTVEEGSEETNSQVSQNLMIAALDKQFPLLYHILHEHISDDVDYKVLVFCTTAMVTKLVAEVFSELKLNVREIHSRKSQSYRTRVSDEFRKSKGLILMTSDVSARGVDYPDVTLVIQVGAPSGREQYIHRLGRTGRKGKEGQGILMLAPWEEYFASCIKDLPISKIRLPQMDPDTNKKVERALAHVETRSKEAAYQSWLGYYNGNKIVGRDKCKLVELANEFSRSTGLVNPPTISRRVLGKMGLGNVPGLRSK